ncbi:gp19 [Listeria phage P40]|nr:gp19 [Listeria phage P40]ACI00379.1 gp19 [Listeria phage P40]
MTMGFVPHLLLSFFCCTSWHPVILNGVSFFYGQNGVTFILKKVTKVTKR